MDFDGDGILDLISGSYDPGEFYLFRGLGEGKFAARETIVDRDGNPVLLYPNQVEEYQSFGSFVAMVDWDDDGDLDLVLGGFGGEMMVRLNEGTRRQPAFATENSIIQADGADLKVSQGHATPVIADWDGDGLWDILSGSANGGVYWYRNIGRPGQPKFAAAVELLPAFEGSGYSEFVDVGEGPKPGIRSQIAVVDYNGDGKLDLLVGDFSTTVAPRDDLTDKQRAEMLECVERYKTAESALFAARARAQAEVQEWLEALPEKERLSDEVQQEARQRYQAAMKKQDIAADSGIYEQAKLDLRQFLAESPQALPHDPFATQHGYVWLYLRK